MLQVNKRKLYIILHWIQLQYSGTKFWFYTMAISTGFHWIFTKHKEIGTTHFLHRLSIFPGMYKYYFVSLLRLRLILLKYLHLLFFSLWCLPPNKNAEVTKERCLICSCCSVACCILFCSKWHDVPSGLPYCQIHYLYITLLVNQWTKMQDSFFPLFLCHL